MNLCICSSEVYFHNLNVFNKISVNHKIQPRTTVFSACCDVYTAHTVSFG